MKTSTELCLKTPLVASKLFFVHKVDTEKISKRKFGESGEGPLAIDFNHHKVGMVAGGFFPKIIVVSGYNDLPKRGNAVCWVGERLAKVLNIKVPKTRQVTGLPTLEIKEAKIWNNVEIAWEMFLKETGGQWQSKELIVPKSRERELEIIIRESRRQDISPEKFATWMDQKGEPVADSHW